MAVNRSVQAALTIALGIFVMMSFALGITTYLFFSQRIEAEQARDTARDEARKAEEARQATLEEMRALRAVIGAEEETPVAEIETGLTSLFEGDFAGFDREPKTYRRLIEWLRDQFKAQAEDVKTAGSEKAAAEARAAADVAAARKAQGEAEQAATEAKAEQKKEADAFMARVTEHQTNLDAARGKQDEQSQRADQLKLLQDEITKGEQYMPASRVTMFKKAVADADYVKMLGLMFAELRERANVIKAQSEELDKLRVPTPEAQQALAAATPADQPIDGFDGFVAETDARTDSVLVSVRTTAGIRPGLLFQVFKADDPRPAAGARKAEIEVTEILGPTLVKASIRFQNARDPVLQGDGVATPLWRAGQSPEIAIVGFADVDGDGQSDRPRLVSLVERAGGRVVEAVGPGTALVVDLGRPPVTEGDPPPEWKSEDNRRKRALAAARDYAIRVSGVPGALDMLGLEPESFEPGRLPRQRGEARLPPRR